MVATWAGCITQEKEGKRKVLLTSLVFYRLKFQNSFIFFQLFCKNIRQFENFTLLITIRRGSRPAPWPTAVSGLTAMGHGGSEVAVGYGGGRRRLQCPQPRHEAAQQPPWATAVACGLPSWATVVSFFN
jgi:hypothetical protein